MQLSVRLLLAETFVDLFAGDPVALERVLSHLRDVAVAARGSKGLDTTIELVRLANTIELERYDRAGDARSSVEAVTVLAPSSVLATVPQPMCKPSEALPDPQAEALDKLVCRILSELVGAGVVPTKLVERVARAQDRIAERALPRDMEARAALSAELARIAVALAEDEPVKPVHLRLVHDADLGRSED